MSIVSGQALRALGIVDLRMIRRDSLLRFMPFLPLLVGLLVRLAGPLLVEQISVRFAINLASYFPLIEAYMLLLIAPAITGIVVGFLLLDQKDDRTLLAMRVTPLSLAHYLAYRLSTPMVVSAMVSWLAIWIARLELSDSWLILPCLLLSALIAPITALVLGIFAANKVQGFALAKALNLFMIAPMIAAFTPLPWQWLFALLPTFWPARLLWAIHFGEPMFSTLFAFGLLVEGAFFYWLLRRFAKSTI